MAKIVAIVVHNAHQVDGGAPIFIAGSPEEQQQLAFSLEKILDANAHDLKNGTIIIVDHAQTT